MPLKPYTQNLGMPTLTASDGLDSSISPRKKLLIIYKDFLQTPALGASQGF